MWGSSSCITAATRSLQRRQHNAAQQLVTALQKPIPTETLHKNMKIKLEKVPAALPVEASEQLKSIGSLQAWSHAWPKSTFSKNAPQAS